MKKYKTFRRLSSAVWKNNKKMRFRIVIGVVLVFLGTLLNVLLPWGLKFIVDYISRPDMFYTLVLLLVSYGIIWLISRLTMDLRQIIIYRAFVKGVNKLTRDVFQKLLNLSMGYHISNSTGSIMSNVERAQISVSVILYNLMFVMLPMFMEVVIAVGVLWYYYGVIISGTLFLVVASYILFTWCCIPWIVDSQRKGNLSHQRVSDYMTDVLMNMEGVYYQSAQKPVSMEFDRRIVNREHCVTKELVRVDMVSMGQNIIMGIGFICMTLIVGFGIMDDKLVVGDFVLINGYLMQILVPLGIIGTSVLHDVREGFTRLESVMELLNEKEEIIDNASAKSVKQKPTAISFENVEFTYPGKKYSTLKRVSFCLPEGKSMAIVGANGAGKSTILKLLYRLFDVSNGSINIQGEDIRDIKLSELRQLVGVIPQDVFLLNDTIYTNILFGIEEHVAKEDFETIVRVTNIEEWINTLPDKYMTPVGEQGVKLSGGEKKRIGIARTLLRKPKILVLDEAMNSLDVDTEYRIFSHIHEHYRDLTRIIVTHHDKYLYDVDKVIYLEGGAIQAEGNHSDLLNKNELYRRLWRK